MMTDRLLALFALVVLIAFVGVVALFVGVTDLIIVSVIVLLLAAYDFWQQLRPGRGNGRS